jgi:hypothetical protein
MNEFFYQSRGKEKIRELRDEGMTNQAYYRSGASMSGILSGIPKLILIILGILGVFQIIVR